MVQVGFPGGPRLEWYDRNPQKSSITYQANDVAPHSSTQRASYTVPSGKKAFIASVSIELARSAAASSLGKAAGFITITGEWAHQVTLWNNTVGAVERSIAGNSGIMLAGETVLIGTFDSSTGGTIDYIQNCVLTEFDA